MARNNGMKIAEGEYIKFLDSDDMIDGVAAEKSYNVAKKYDADMLKYSFKYIERGQSEWEKCHCIYDKFEYISEEKSNLSSFYYKFKKGIPVSPCAGLYKNKFLKANNIKFFSEIKRVAEDDFFNIACVSRLNKIVFMPDRMYIHRFNPISIMTLARKSGNLEKIRIKSVTCGTRKLCDFWKNSGLFSENKMKADFLSFILNHGLFRCIRNNCSLFVSCIDPELLQDDVINQLPYNEAYSINLILKNANFNKDQFLKQMPQILKKYYRDKFNRELDLENPKTYSEKVQWLKLYDSTPLKTKLADKYLVKDWIKEKVGEKYVVPLLGVWDKFDDIDFDKLPNKFVLKTNHGNGSNIFVEDKSKFDKIGAKMQFDKWLSTDYAFKNPFELHYHNIKPKIIAEQYLENNKSDIYGYKVFCFDGKPRYIMVMNGKTYGYSVAFYDNNWKLQPFQYIRAKYYNKLVDKPKNLSEMLNVAQILSEGFCHNNIDFFVLNDGSIKIFEMEFLHGDLHFNDHKYDKLFGDLMTLPKEKYDYRKIFESDGVELLVKNKLIAVEKDTASQVQISPGETQKMQTKPSSKTLDNGIYTISSKLDSNKCLAIKNGSKNNCANLQLLDRSGTDAQKFKIQYHPDGYYTIKAMCSGKMLDVLGGSKNILQCTKNKRNSQKWFIVPDGEGFCCLVSKSNDSCMTVDDANVCCSGVHGGDNQRFKLEKCGG